MAIQPVAPQIATTLPGSLTEEAIAVRGALLDREPGRVVAIWGATG